MKNTIQIEAPDYLTAIAGEDFARTMCKEQVLPFVDNDKLNTIIFPKHIQASTQSFINCFMFCIKKNTTKETKFEFKATGGGLLEDKLNKTYDNWETVEK